MEVKLDRRPYKVEYYKDGKKHVITRTPPPKLHRGVAGDVVTINRKRNVDWDEGEDVWIKNISSRAPNTLQIEKEDGKSTFVGYYDVNFYDWENDQTGQDAKAKKRDPIGSDYLLWP